LYSRNADGPTIVRAKAESFRTGEVIDLTEQWTKEATRRLARCTHHADRQAVDAFLIRIRSSFLNLLTVAGRFRAGEQCPLFPATIAASAVCGQRIVDDPLPQSAPAHPVARDEK